MVLAERGCGAKEEEWASRQAHCSVLKVRRQPPQPPGPLGCSGGPCGRMVPFPSGQEKTPGGEHRRVWSYLGLMRLRLPVSDARFSPRAPAKRAPANVLPRRDCSIYQSRPAPSNHRHQGDAPNPPSPPPDRRSDPPRLRGSDLAVQLCRPARPDVAGVDPLAPVEVVGTVAAPERIVAILTFDVVAVEIAL